MGGKHAYHILPDCTICLLLILKINSMGIWIFLLHTLHYFIRVSCLLSMLFRKLYKLCRFMEFLEKNLRLTVHYTLYTYVHAGLKLRGNRDWICKLGTQNHQFQNILTRAYFSFSWLLLNYPDFFCKYSTSNENMFSLPQRKHVIFINLMKKNSNNSWVVWFN